MRMLGAIFLSAWLLLGGFELQGMQKLHQIEYEFGGLIFSQNSLALKCIQELTQGENSHFMNHNYFSNALENRDKKIQELQRARDRISEKKRSFTAIQDFFSKLFGGGKNPPKLSFQDSRKFKKLLSAKNKANDLKKKIDRLLAKQTFFESGLKAEIALLAQDVEKNPAAYQTYLSLKETNPKETLDLKKLAYVKRLKCFFWPKELNFQKKQEITQEINQEKKQEFVYFCDFFIQSLSLYAVEEFKKPRNNKELSEIYNETVEARMMVEYVVDPIFRCMISIYEGVISAKDAQQQQQKQQQQQQQQLSAVQDQALDKLVSELKKDQNEPVQFTLGGAPLTKTKNQAPPPPARSPSNTQQSPSTNTRFALPLPPGNGGAS